MHVDKKSKLLSIPFIAGISAIFLSSCSFIPTSTTSTTPKEEKLVLKYKFKDDAYSVIGFESKTVKCTAEIPATYNDGINGEHPVTEIGESALKDSFINALKFDENSNIKRICERAFYNCGYLTQLKLPEGVEFLGEHAFDKAPLTSIILCDTLKHIEHNVFYEPTLTYNTKDNAYYLGSSTNPFYALIRAESTNITECELSHKTKVIAESAFANCLLKDLIIPKQTQYINTKAFLNNLNLESLVFEDESELVEIGDNAFNFCRSIKSIVLPNSLEAMGTSAFANTVGLTSICLSNNMTVIPRNAFSYSGVENITIPSSITTIDNEAFRNCLSLKEIIIPESVTTMGSYVFGNNKTVIYAEALEAQPNWQTGWSDDCVVVYGHISHGTFEDFEYAIFRKLDLSVETTITNYIGTSENVVIPAKINNYAITHIDNYAFFEVETMKTISIPSTVVVLGDYAFKGSGLTSVTLPDRCDKVGKYCFAACSSLETVIVNPSLLLIDESAFSGCSALNSINLKDSICTFGEFAFAQCGFETFTFPDAIKVLPMGILGGNIKCQTINIPDGVVEIGKMAFFGDVGIKEFIAPTSLKVMYSMALAGCVQLEKVVFSNNVLTLSDSILNGCALLKELTIPFVGKNVVTNATDDQYPFGYLFGQLTESNVLFYKSHEYYQEDGVVKEIDYDIPLALTKVKLIQENAVVLTGAFMDLKTLVHLEVSDPREFQMMSISNCPLLVDIVVKNGDFTIQSGFVDSCPLFFGFFAMLDNPASWVVDYQVAHYSADTPTPEVGKFYWHYDSNNDPVLYA